MPPITYRFLSLFAVLILAACVRGTPGEEWSASAPPEAAVYAAVLTKIYRGPPPDTVVARDSTLVFRVPTGGVPEWRQEFDSIPAPLTEALAAVSAKLVPTASLPLLNPVRTLSTDERRALFREGPRAGWEEFRRRFPSARLYFALTPVAFSADSAQALVYYDYHCGSLCGGGNAVWLTREPVGEWVVRKTVMFWVS